MPTYEYECTECGHLFEVFQSITAEPIKKCPKCNGKARRLLGTGIGIIFKGSGFYATDYRKSQPTTKDNATNNGKTSGKKDKEQTTVPSEKSKNENESKNNKKSNNE